jgi:tellurium resistance protein TerZ
MAKPLPIGVGTFFVGVSWDFVAGNAADIDIQAVAVDSNACIVDAVYYNNLHALGRSLVHSGDEVDGKTEGVDEKITVNLRTLPAHITALVFCVCCYKAGQTFRDVRNGRVMMVSEETTGEHRGQRVYDASLAGKGSTSACVVLLVFRDMARGWSLRPINEAWGGHHFMDILEGINYCALHHIFPNTPAKVRVDFKMNKGEVMDFATSTKRLKCGLGWDITKGKVDIDASCCIFDNVGTELETVYFGHLKSTGTHSKPGAVRHSGDNLTGVGDGDDEVITVQLDQLGPSVHSLIFVITIYSWWYTFADVANPFCRVVDDATKEPLCMYKLADAGPFTALVIARLSRNAAGGWGFHALGLPSKGHTYRSVMPYLRVISVAAPRQIAAGLLAPPPDAPSTSILGKPYLWVALLVLLLAIAYKAVL